MEKLTPPEGRLVEYEIPEFTGRTNIELWEYVDQLIAIILKSNNDKKLIKEWSSK